MMTTLNRLGALDESLIRNANRHQTLESLRTQLLGSWPFDEMNVEVERSNLNRAEGMVDSDGLQDEDGQQPRAALPDRCRLPWRGQRGAVSQLLRERQVDWTLRCGRRHRPVDSMASEVRRGKLPDVEIVQTTKTLVELGREASGLVRGNESCRYRGGSEVPKGHGAEDNYSAARKWRTLVRC